MAGDFEVFNGAATGGIDTGGAWYPVGFVIILGQVGCEGIINGSNCCWCVVCCGGGGAILEKAGSEGKLWGACCMKPKPPYSWIGD
jgi:hypothetical protein